MNYILKAKTKQGDFSAAEENRWIVRIIEHSLQDNRSSVLNSVHIRKRLRGVWFEDAAAGV